jgi:hypothetical protein
MYDVSVSTSVSSLGGGLHGAYLILDYNSLVQKFTLLFLVCDLR